MKSRLAVSALILTLAAPAAQAVKLYANDGTYLGNLSANKYDPDSTSNPYGRYGNPYSPDSINNEFGKYGSPYSPESVNNPYAISEPTVSPTVPRNELYGQQDGDQ